MLIVCPTCATTYQIKLAALGEAGRNVRCANCKNTWFATPDSAVMQEVAPGPAKAARAIARAEAPAAGAKAGADDFAQDAESDIASGFAVETDTPIADPAA